MTAHRTWGVFFRSIPNYMQLTEVAFLTAASVDLSVGGSAGASTDYGAGFQASNAFDKSTSTDWCSASYDQSCRIWYVHPAAVEPVKVRIRCSASSYIPDTAIKLGVRSSDDFGATWGDEFTLTIASGAFSSGATVVLNIAPARPLELVPMPQLLEQNFLQPLSASTGTVSDRVMFKATPTAPESPFANGRIWLLRLADGYKAWEGWSDSGGYYTAIGLELGVEYIAVGIDPYRNHKATVAGPVVATEAVP